MSCLKLYSHFSLSHSSYIHTPPPPPSQFFNTFSTLKSLLAEHFDTEAEHFALQVLFTNRSHDNMAPSKGVLLAHTDFPLYTVRSLDERHFLVAGGGGQAKTGIANAIVRHYSVIYHFLCSCFK